MNYELTKKNLAVEVCLSVVLKKMHVFAQAPWTTGGSALGPAWPSTGTISFQNFGLRYHKASTWALRDICIDILDGEKVGSGKLKAYKFIIKNKKKKNQLFNLWPTHWLVGWDRWKIWCWKIIFGFGNISYCGGYGREDSHWRFGRRWCWPSRSSLQAHNHSPGQWQPHNSSAMPTAARILMWFIYVYFQHYCTFMLVQFILMRALQSRKYGNLLCGEIAIASSPTKYTNALRP